MLALDFVSFSMCLIALWSNLRYLSQLHHKETGHTIKAILTRNCKFALCVGLQVNSIYSINFLSPISSTFARNPSAQSHYVALEFPFRTVYPPMINEPLITISILLQEKSAG